MAKIVSWECDKCKEIVTEGSFLPTDWFVVLVCDDKAANSKPTHKFFFCADCTKKVFNL